MERHLFGIIILAALSLTPCLAPADVHVNVSLPPPIPFSAPPDVVVIPSNGAYVYMVPNTVGLYFYGGHWYRFHDGHWFRASHYSAPWTIIEAHLVPTPVAVIPYDYILHMPPTYHRIPYHAFHKHWRDWGPKRHWHNYQWYRDHSSHRWAGHNFHRPPAHGHSPRPPLHGGPKAFVAHPDPRHRGGPHLAGTLRPASYAQPHAVKGPRGNGHHGKWIEARHHNIGARGANRPHGKESGGRRNYGGPHGRDR